MRTLNVKLYFKILQGYDKESSVPITENELERAYGLFMLGGRWIFSGGPVDGKNIRAIAPDYNRTMGWNSDYKLSENDYAEINNRGIDSEARSIMAFVSETVKELVASGRVDLIGKERREKQIESPKIEDLSKQQKEIEKKIDEVAKKKRIDHENTQNGDSIDNQKK